MKNRKNYPHVDDELIAVFKETFKDDEQSLNEALEEAERAFSYVGDDHEWYPHAANGNYELF
jgi:hypothetical protein